MMNSPRELSLSAKRQPHLLQAWLLQLYLPEVEVIIQ